MLFKSPIRAKKRRGKESLKNQDHCIVYLPPSIWCADMLIIAVSQSLVTSSCPPSLKNRKISGRSIQSQGGYGTRPGFLLSGPKNI
jgi:hypothetical protein